MMAQVLGSLCGRHELSSEFLASAFPVLVVVGIWEVNQWAEDSLFLSVLSLWLSNRMKINKQILYGNYAFICYFETWVPGCLLYCSSWVFIFHSQNKKQFNNRENAKERGKQSYVLSNTALWELSERSSQTLKTGKAKGQHNSHPPPGVPASTGCSELRLQQSVNRPTQKSNRREKCRS